MIRWNLSRNNIQVRSRTIPATKHPNCTSKQLHYSIILDNVRYHSYLTQRTKSPLIDVLSRMRKTPVSRSDCSMLFVSSRDTIPKYQLQQRNCHCNTTISKQITPFSKWILDKDSRMIYSQCKCKTKTTRVQNLEQPRVHKKWYFYSTQSFLVNSNGNCIEQHVKCVQHSQLNYLYKHDICLTESITQSN